MPGGSEPMWSVERVTPFATTKAPFASRKTLSSYKLGQNSDASRVALPVPEGRRPYSGRWKPVDTNTSSFKLTVMPGGESIVTCEPDVNQKNPYTGLSLAELDNPNLESTRVSMNQYRVPQMPSSILPKKTFVCQDYPVQKIPSQEEQVKRYFRANSSNRGGQLSAESPFRLTSVKSAPTKRDKGRWSTMNTMDSFGENAYNNRRFSRQNKALQLAISLKNAYSTGDVKGRGAPEPSKSRLPSLRRSKSGSYGTTFDF